MPGLYFEHLEDGQIIEHPWACTMIETDNILFSSMTMNPAKLHIDTAYSAPTEADQPIIESRHETINQRSKMDATCRCSALMLGQGAP